MFYDFFLAGVGAGYVFKFNNTGTVDLFQWHFQKLVLSGGLGVAIWMVTQRKFHRCLLSSWNVCGI